MNTVRLQSYSWISNTLGIEETSTHQLREKVKEGTTLVAFLAELAGKFPEFRKMVFNPETGQLSEQVLIILNNRLIQYSEIQSIVLKDKDHITLAPVIFGG
jgi:molybdopterin converting factor small subunit